MNSIVTTAEGRTGVTVHLPGVVPFFLEHGERARIEKAHMPFLPAQFSESSLSLKLGAGRVFRDQSRTDSLQLREYDDCWLVELDHYNPEQDGWAFVGHAIVDAPLVTLAVGGIAALFVAALNS